MGSNLSATVDELFLSSLNEGKEVRLRVDGTSMAPCLKPGDRIVLQQAAAKLLQKGDLVVVRRQHDLVTHRLVHQDAGRWVTKGDNTRYPDPPAPENRILGKVIAIEKPHKTIDLRTARWQFLNRWLANWSWLEASLFRLGHQFQSGNPNGRMELESSKRSSVARLLSLPFRFFFHLIFKIL